MPEPTTVFCGNLPVGCTSKELLDLFEPYGEIHDHNMVKTYAFIQFVNKDDAEKAVKDLQGSKMSDRTLTVQVSVRKEKDSGAGSKRTSDRRDRDKDRSRDRRNAPYNRRDGPPPAFNMPMAFPGADPLSAIAALTGQLGVSQLDPNFSRGADFDRNDRPDGPSPLNDAHCIYERYFVDPSHPLLKGLPLPKMPNLYGR